MELHEIPTGQIVQRLTGGKAAVQVAVSQLLVGDSFMHNGQQFRLVTEHVTADQCSNQDRVLYDCGLRN